MPGPSPYYSDYKPAGFSPGGDQLYQGSDGVIYVWRPDGNAGANAWVPYNDASATPPQPPTSGTDPTGGKVMQGAAQPVGTPRQVAVADDGVPYYQDQAGGYWTKNADGTWSQQTLDPSTFKSNQPTPPPTTGGGGTGGGGGGVHARNFRTA